ncbi:MAG: ABC transporter substrate-binding protein [Paracoccus sp. (in: a-proteobacteria)]|uniref:ABC transporter substrate-binding protein n=1 Tax=Paracoccus sp. TaxID=267 RepID=UPI0026DEE699|nr:ABC transporter substrate-binding protein [Paracoccus sp. (in: a-proteobacteria)]MDO5614482.1 ABC transporter substrate-binding protein [Paracoccus sp. (in: a-proteobacteria)]
MRVLPAATAFAVICLAVPAFAGTDYPLEFNNCGVSLRFEAAPDSVVSIGQGTTEILYSLGLADKVKGTGVWFTSVLPEYAEVNANVPRLDDNAPSFESIVEAHPSLVTSQYEWHIGPEGAIATREQFADLNIQTYVMAADCEGKDNTTGSSGVRDEIFTMDAVWQTVTDLAAIFDVPERGEELIASLKAQEAAAIEQAQALDLGDASALFWFSSADMDIDPYVAGRKGTPAYMMQALGLRNVVESDEEWPVVSWETIARANPTVIVVAEMERRRFPADDVEKKLEFLRTDPVASQMDAVVNDRIVVMDGHSMRPSIRNVMGLKQLAEALAGYQVN